MKYLTEADRSDAQRPLIARRDFLGALACGGAGILSPDFAIAASCEAPQPEPFGQIVSRLSPVIRLYGAGAAAIEGSAELDKLKISISSSGSAEMIWNVTAQHTGDFQVFLSYAAPRDGIRLKIVCGRSAVSQSLPATQGVYLTNPNFQRIQLQGKLRLNCGVNPVKLRLASEDSSTRLHVRCLELIPSSAAAGVDSSAMRAVAHGANTDWLANAGYGVMFHWTDFSQPQHGPQKSYQEAVKAFAVAPFAEMVEGTGAAYVIFTVDHAHPHCPAPIQSWERIHPGWTTRRDLIGEIAAELERRDIRLFLYINSPTLGKLNFSRPAVIGQPTYSEEQYLEIHKHVLTEIGQRYGQRVAGYWFDSWYQSLEAYPDIPFEKLYGFTKAGNPRRITAFNFWIFPVLTEWQDYWAGELNRLQNPFLARTIQHGAGKGFQAHGLITMLPSWVHNKPGPMPPPQFGADDLIQYVEANAAQKAATTINIGIYQEGTISDESRRMMDQLRRAIRAHGR